MPRRAGRIALTSLAALSVAFVARFATRPGDPTAPTTSPALAHTEEPGSAREWARVGDLALRGRRLGRAESAFLQALRLDPGQAPAHLGLAWIHTLRMRRSEAISEYSAADELRPLDSG